MQRNSLSCQALAGGVLRHFINRYFHEHSLGCGSSRSYGVAADWCGPLPVDPVPSTTEVTTLAKCSFSVCIRKKDPCRSFCNPHMSTAQARDSLTLVSANILFSSIPCFPLYISIQTSVSSPTLYDHILCFCFPSQLARHLKSITCGSVQSSFGLLHPGPVSAEGLLITGHHPPSQKSWGAFSECPHLPRVASANKPREAYLLSQYLCLRALSMDTA